ncbi:odorant receptor 59a-like [Zeugodacus cucurbitae]|uniref:odorant receptor 59a-like n=1 Tax=Zeugodacus cucurbitae TaxID=28588 RepID=UPI0005968FED|nr:odorant receptor 59a-like [Zeugodacus cucurbitae]
MNNSPPVDSRQFFRTHWRLWLLLGCVREPVHYQLLYRLYSTVVNALIMLFYPGTILIALYNSANLTDFLQTLPICAAALACSAKYISYYRRLGLVRQAEQIFNALDEQVLLPEDREFYAGIHRGTNLILNTLRGLCIFFMAITVMAFASSIEERGLAFAIELPFDWRKSSVAYVGAVGLELLLLSCDLLQSLANDSFPAIALCVLSNHTRLLGARLARIGHTSKDVQANIREMQRCIIDHQRLYRLQAIIEEIISMPVFIQYAVTAFQDCFTLITFIFYTNTVSDKVLYLTYLLALQLQIFPTCYYGTACAQSMDDLQQEIYASNWVEQNQVYRRLVTIFSQRTLKSTTTYAAGLIPIHLSAFVKTLQGAYSFYTFVDGVRKV